MPDNKVFYNPKDFGSFDMGTGQLDKVFTFVWNTVVISQCKVVVRDKNNIIKTYTEGNGLTRTNSNFTVLLTISGSDFQNYVGKKLNVDCNFFVQGDTEVVFGLTIVKTYIL